MTNQKTLIKGWSQAFFSVLILWGLNNVMIGYSAQILHVNYIIYTCSAFVSCALCLLIVGGKGPLVKETFRSVDTWAFGLIMLIGYVLTLSLFSFVSSTEGSLLQRISLLFSVLISWFFLNRKPTKGQFIGVILVIIGIGFVCRDLPEENKGIIYMLMFLEGLALTGRMFIAEIHRPHKQALTMENDPRAKARVVGFVMFVISTLFFVLTALFAIVQTFAPLPVDIVFLPNIQDFRHSPSIFAGIIAGIVLIAPLRLIEFSSTSIIKTENFLAIAALSSAATLFWEWLLQPITGMSLKTVSSNDILAGILITFGCLVAALGKVRTRRKQNKWKEYIFYAAQDPEQVDDSREIVANTLEHFEGDTNKTAKALEISTEAINAILMDEDKVLAFKPKVLKDTARHYRQKVARVDALTGLPNRSAFMAELRNASHEGNIYSVLFIDLNKFKPVNDTYGHEAGDTVLKGIAKRLQEIALKDSVVTRLGGDEYCILLPKTTKNEAKSHIKKTKSTIAKPFKIAKNTISVSASIGVATYPTDSQNPEELIKLADEGMYGEKNER